MKSLLFSITILLLITSIRGFSDNKLLIFEDFYVLESEIYNSSDIIIKSINNDNFLINATPTLLDSSYSYILTNLSKNKKKAVNINTNHQYMEIFDFTIDDKKLYLLTFQYVFVYDLETDKLEKKVSHLYFHNNVKIVGTSLYAFSCLKHGYNILTDCKCQIFKHNLLTSFNELINTDFKEPYGSNFLYFTPRNIIDINSRHEILLSDIISYNIRIYDRYFNTIDSIVSKSKDWILDENDKIFFDTLKTNHYNSRNEMNAVRKYTEKLNLVHFASFVSDTNVLVVYSKPGSRYRYKFFIDYWHKSTKDGWLLKSTEELHRYKKSDVLSFKSFAKHPISISEDKVFFEGNIPFTKEMMLSNYIGEDLNKFNKDLEEHYIDNPLVKSIIIFKLVN